MGSRSMTGTAPEGNQRAERGRADRRRAAKRARRRRKRSLVREIPLIMLVALVITLLLQTFFVQVFSIPSGSMQNTIAIGDRVVVNKLSPWLGWKPQRGEVIVFNDPDNWLASDPVPKDGPVLGAVKSVFTFVGLLPSDRDLIKRVIGVPGDTVACCDSKGRVTVNGKPLDESSYIYPGNPPSTITFKVTVPPGKLWVMGDHRDISADSRYHMTDKFGGMVPISDVVGHAFVLIWPPSRAGGLGVPATFQQEGLTVLSSLPTGTLPVAALVGAVPFRLVGGRAAGKARRRRARRRAA